MHTLHQPYVVMRENKDTFKFSGGKTQFAYVWSLYTQKTLNLPNDYTRKFEILQSMRNGSTKRVIQNSRQAFITKT